MLSITIKRCLVFLGCNLGLTQGLQSSLASSDDDSKPQEGNPENLCIEGRIAPEIILLGAARASTSLFAQNLHRSPGIMFPECQKKDNRDYSCPPEGLKEMHWFNHEERYSRGRTEWLSHYPSCKKHSARTVSVDLTPAYLINTDVPHRMMKYYGGDLPRVQFLVFIREPIKIMQSFFYYEGEKKISFQDWAAIAIKSKQGRYWANAMYAPNLEYYFNVFDPAQFTIVPMTYNVVGGKDGEQEVTDFMWEKFGLAEPPKGEKIFKEWNVGTHKHPPVEKDLDVQTLAELHKVAYEVTGPEVLAKLFAKAQGLHLYGYKGKAKDKGAIAAWIEDGW